MTVSGDLQEGSQPRQALRYKGGSHLLWLGLAMLLVIATFGLYARTMAPGLLDGDEGEFQTNIYRLGVSHTGYPLFFLLGKLWTILVPVGSMATRANMFAAFWGALAVLSIIVFIRFLTGNPWSALMAAGLFAASRVEWSQSIIPRPYTLNSLFVVLVAFAFFLWRTGKVDLTVPLFVVGLSLTNHRTMIWFAPAIGLFILLADYSATFKSDKPSGNPFAVAAQWVRQSSLFKIPRLISLVTAFLLPLLLYLYVFWRGDSHVGVEFHMKDFGDMILAGNASRWMRYGPLDWLVSRVTDLYIPLLIEQFTAAGFIVGWIGIIALILDRPPRGWPKNLPAREALLFVALANLGNSLFCVFFWTTDVEKFFLPSYITFLFFVGVGIAVLWDWIANRLGTPLRVAGQGVLVLFFLGTVGFLFTQNLPVNDFSHRTDVIETWQENLSLPLENHALVVGPWESLTPLEYAMYVDGQRTDLERWKVIVKKDQLGLVNYGSRQQDIEREVRAGRPVYLTVHPGETETLGSLADEFRMTRVGGLWRLLNLAAQGQNPGGTRTRFTDASGRKLDLLGYTIYPARNLSQGGFGLLTLYWGVPETISARVTISLRLMDSQDRVAYQRDSEPANGTRSTVGWASGETVQDDIGFFVPLSAQPGAYRLRIVVYDPATNEEWMEASTNRFFEVGIVNVLP